MSRALSFTMKSLSGEDVDMGKYLGKVVMIVNVASKCGFTLQYEQLQALHEKYSQDGLAILGFPCNQFLFQERGTAEQIQEFCRVRYGVTFDMFAKIRVNGDDACELYKYLTSVDTTPVGFGRIGWNFAKFILDRYGEVIARFSPKTRPDDPEVLKVIETELAKKRWLTSASAFVISLVIASPIRERLGTPAVRRDSSPSHRKRPGNRDHRRLDNERALFTDNSARYNGGR